GGGHRGPGGVRVMVHVAADDVVADREPRPVRHAAAAEHPLVVVPAVREQRLGLLPEGAFLASADGPVRWTRWSGERRQVEDRGDALGDDLLEQADPGARPADDPAAVVDLG